MNDFEGFGLSPAIITALTEMGIDKPTPIQEKAIPIAMQGRDVVGLAQTGTGKTAAFGLPLAERLMGHGKRPEQKSARSLILAPTRELVNQIAVNLKKFVGKTHLRVTSVVGGSSINIQIRDLNRGTDILVATPGRLLDLEKRNAIRLDKCEFLVLDEADQMLDLGFIVPLRKIEKLVNPTRQTMLFSATMPKQIEELAATFLTNPARVETAPAGKAADKIKQSVHYVTGRAKPALLREMLEKDGEGLSLVFARTKHGAEKLKNFLVQSELSAGSIHGNKSQGQRERAIKGFKEGKIKILVATDVAARGIDIPGVARVFNFNLPEVPEAYVHRIGRTARAGASGEAIAFCAPDEVHLLRAVERLMKIDIKEVNPEMLGEFAKMEPEAKPQRGGSRKQGGHRGKGGQGRDGAGPKNGKDQVGKPRRKPAKANPNKPDGGRPSGSKRPAGRGKPSNRSGGRAKA